MENNDSLKQRLVGAAVLISLVVVFLPMLVDDGPGPHPDRPAVPPVQQWRFSDPTGDPYQPPTQPQRAPVEVIEHVGTEAASTSPTAASDGNGNGNAAQPDSAQRRAGQTPASSAQLASGTSQPPQQTHPADLLEATVKGGDTLYGIFRRLGLEPSQVREVVNVSGARESLSRLRPGQRLRIRVDGNKRIVAMEYLHGGGPALRIKRIGSTLQRVSGSRQASAASRPSASTGSSSVAASRPVASKPPPAIGSGPSPSREQGPVAWAVQIGVYKDWDAARKVQAALRKMGHAAFLKSVDTEGGKRWHLKVGPQLKKRDAITLARSIQQQTGKQTQVVSYP